MSFLLAKKFFSKNPLTNLSNWIILADKFTNPKTEMGRVIPDEYPTESPGS